MVEKKMNWPIIRNRNKCKQILCFYSCINNCFEEISDFLLFKENIALRKPAYQENQYLGINASSSDASNAVDGLKSDLSTMGGQCKYSADHKQTATWWVNLTSIHAIHYVTIYYMTNNAPWGMQLIINIVYVIISEQLEVHFDIDAFEHISFLFRSARLNLIKLYFSYRNTMIIFLSFCLWNMWIFDSLDHQDASTYHLIVLTICCSLNFEH